MRRRALLVGSVGALAAACTRAAPQVARVPVIDGPFRRIATNPDLGPLTGPQQQTVDFAVWRAADGTWQLWGCVRGANIGGETRLFHRWEAAAFTDAAWSPRGIALEADTRAGETAGGLQAPFVLLVDGVYRMFYGDWKRICVAESRDGKTFTRRLDAGGSSAVIVAPDETNARDAMVLRVGGLWHLYYAAHPDGRGAVFLRTSADLEVWGPSRVVARGGVAGDGPYAAECPFVVERPDDGGFFLFRTQVYGQEAATRVYRASDPAAFGVDDDRALVATLPVAAPEIVQHDGRDWIVTPTPGLDGYQVAPLAWRAL